MGPKDLEWKTSWLNLTTERWLLREYGDWADEQAERLKEGTRVGLGDGEREWENEGIKEGGGGRVGQCGRKRLWGKGFYEGLADFLTEEYRELLDEEWENGEKWRKDWVDGNRWVRLWMRRGIGRLGRRGHA